MLSGTRFQSALSIGTALLGALCLGVTARWQSAGAGETAFGIGLWGRPLGLWPRAEWAALWSHGTPGLAGLVAGPLSVWCAALVGGLGLGVLVARGLAPRPGARWAGVAAALPVLLVPAVGAFVASRPPATAFAYLDLEDLARGLGLALLLVAAWPRLQRADREAPDPVGPDGSGRWRASACAAALFAVVLSGGLSEVALGGEPLTNDGVSYRFQAEQFAAGRSWAPAGHQADFFPARQIARAEDRVFSKYPPGHSAVLALGVLTGLGAWVPRLLGGLAVWLTAWLARWLGAPRPELAAWLLALSPAFLGVEALWLSHGTSLPAALAFACLALAARDATQERGAQRRALVAALGAGAALSVVFVARPLTALAFAAPFLVELLHARPRGWPRLVLAVALGGLPAGLWFLSVNAAQTGDALQTAYAHYAANVAPDDRWGLVNAGEALERTAYNTARASIWFHGFALSLVGIALGAASFRAARRSVLLWSPLALLLAAYSLHRFHGIPWAGPLYLVEALPLVAILSSVALAELGSASRRAVLAAAVAGSALLLAAHFSVARELAEARAAPRRAAERAGLERGLVFVRLERPEEFKRFPLPPPAVLDARAGLLFARDLGPRNGALATAAGEERAWLYLPREDRLVPWRERGVPGD